MAYFDNETMELVLANRAFLYGLAARVYACEPDQELFSIMLGEHAEEEVALLQDEWTDGLTSSFAACCELAAKTENAVGRISAEYVALFVGPAAQLLPAWETVCRSGKPVLFQRDLLDVRESYERAGFRSVRFPQVADDFIGIELDFLAKLAAFALRAFAEGDAEACATRLGQSRQFLNEHLLLWIDDLAAEVAKASEDSFYANFTEFSALLAHRDEALIGHLLEA